MKIEPCLMRKHMKHQKEWNIKLKHLSLNHKKKKADILKQITEMNNMINSEENGKKKGSYLGDKMKVKAPKCEKSEHNNKLVILYPQMQSSTIP